MQSVQEPNYTQVPNEVIDKWMSELSGLEFKIIMFICRKTFGWHKKQDPISISQIQKALGVQMRGHIHEALQRLEGEYLKVAKSKGKTTLYSLVIKTVPVVGTPAVLTVPLRGTDCSPEGNSTVPVGGTTKEIFKETLQNKQDSGEVADVPSRKRMPPTVKDVEDYMHSLQITGFRASEFIDHYAATGWMRGQAKIKDWQACVRTWRDKRISTKSGLSAAERIKMGYQKRGVGNANAG
jgi:phage replication O-like protein O